jgi:hypothetical protein
LINEEKRGFVEMKWKQAGSRSAVDICKSSLFDPVSGKVCICKIFMYSPKYV